MTRIVKKAKKTATKIAQLTAWSYSRFRDYLKCPAYAKYKHVDKMKEPDSDAGAHGTDVHEEAAAFVDGKTKKLGADLRYFKKELENLKKQGAQTEKEWAFTREWAATNWFDMEKAWLRIKVDAHYLTQGTYKVGRSKIIATTVVIIDYKTGKIHDDHKSQRSLYALGAMLTYPDAQTVVVQHWYVDNGEIHEDKYEAADLDELKEHWVSETVPMFRDRKFPPRPANHCRWCAYSKAKGGPCRF